ncbi:MAG: hypothetical protein AAFQ94_14765 [Bacteroidota bacterium]
MKSQLKLHILQYFVSVFILSLSSIFSFQLMAQDESVSYSTVAEKEQNTAYYNYFDINQYEQKIMFKANLLGVENLVSFTNSLDNKGERDLPFINSFAVEYKLRPAISIELEGMARGSLNQDQASWLNPGIRYYPHKRRKSKSKNNSVDNFSGQYLRLGYFRRFNDPDNFYHADSGYRLAFGMQQRSSNWDYLDVSAVIAYNDIFGAFDLSTRIAGGLAFAKPTKANNKVAAMSGQSDVSWSTPILEVDNLYLQFARHRIQINPALEGEFHLLKFWTIKPRIGTNFVNNKSAFGVDRAITYGYDASLAIRKYIGVLKRMSNGYNVRSFSGSYIMLNFANIYERVESVDSADFPSRDINRFNFAPQLGFGFQERLGRRFLFDTNWSVGYDPNQKAVNTYFYIGAGILLKA